MEQANKAKILDMEIKLFEFKIKKTEAKIESLKNLKVDLEKNKILLKQAKQLRNEFAAGPISLESIDAALNDLDATVKQKFRCDKLLTAMENELRCTPLDDRSKKLFEIDKNFPSMIQRLKKEEKDILDNLEKLKIDIELAGLTPEKTEVWKTRATDIQNMMDIFFKSLNKAYAEFFESYQVEIEKLKRLHKYNKYLTNILLTKESSKEIIEKLEQVRKLVYNSTVGTYKHLYHQESSEVADNLFKMISENIESLSNDAKKEESVQQEGDNKPVNEMEY